MLTNNTWHTYSGDSHGALNVIRCRVVRKLSKSGVQSPVSSLFPKKWSDNLSKSCKYGAALSKALVYTANALEQELMALIDRRRGNTRGCTARHCKRVIPHRKQLYPDMGELCVYGLRLSTLAFYSKVSERTSLYKGLLVVVWDKLRMHLQPKRRIDRVDCRWWWFVWESVEWGEYKPGSRSLQCLRRFVAGIQKAIVFGEPFVSIRRVQLKTAWCRRIQVTVSADR